MNTSGLKVWCQACWWFRYNVHISLSVTRNTWNWSERCASVQKHTPHSKNLMEKIRFGPSEAPNIFLLVHDGYRFRSRAGAQSGSSGEVSINKALWVIWCSFWKTQKPQSVPANGNIGSRVVHNTGFCFKGTRWDGCKRHKPCLAVAWTLSAGLWVYSHWKCKKMDFCGVLNECYINWWIALCNIHHTYAIPQRY